MQYAAPLHSVAGFHFAHKRRPLGFGQACDFVVGQLDHARRVINAGGPTQTAFLLGLERALLRNNLGGALA